MKPGLKHIIGKQIAAMVVARNPHPPLHQVFLVFTDGTRFEFWGDAFNCCAGLDEAGGIERYVKSRGGEVIYCEPPDVAAPQRPPLRTGSDGTTYQVGTPETLESLMTRDLDAWREAKAAIAKAQR